MNKATVISALNVMIENPDKISDIRQSSISKDDYAFRYLDRVWSIWTMADGDIMVTFYPSVTSPSEVFDRTPEDSVEYSTLDFKTREAKETFSELMRVIKGRHYKMDDVFNEILSLAEHR